MEIKAAPELKSEIIRICKSLKFDYIKPENIITFKSYGSKSKAVARIWSLPKIWQKALNVKPYYCLEVISEKFDRLSSAEKQKVLIHELLHIPKNFSGALLSHNHNGRKINSKVVNQLFNKIVKNRKCNSQE